MGDSRKQGIHRSGKTIRRVIRVCLPLLIIPGLVTAIACASRSANPAKPIQSKRTLACIPRTVSQENKVSLAIVAVEVQPGKTRVKLVAYAPSEAVDFHLPVYLMSRGRWTIDDRERAYLLDESCREYKLIDRKSTDNMKAPIDGKVQLKPQGAFETILEFPALQQDVSSGVLVYGGQVVPFTLMESRSSSF